MYNSCIYNCSLLNMKKQLFHMRLFFVCHVFHWGNIVKKILPKWGIGKRDIKEDGYIGMGVYRRGFQTFCTLWSQTYIATLQKSRKRVGSKMKLWGAPILMGPSFKNLPFRITWHSILLRNAEGWPEISLSFWSGSACQILP